MAATLTPVVLGRAGDDFTTNGVAATNTGDSWANTGKEILAINNGSGSSVTVTLVFGSGAILDGQTPANRTVTVLAGKTAIIGPFPANLYCDANNLANVTYSAVTSVKVRVYQYPV